MPTLTTKLFSQVGKKLILQFVGKLLSLRAIIKFRKLRVQSLFLEDNKTDLVDIGIIQARTQAKIDVVETRIDKLEHKMDLILEKLTEMSKKQD